MGATRLRLQFALNMLTAMFALWHFRLSEGYVEFNVLLLMWLFFPVTALGLGFLFRKHAAAGVFFVLSVVYLAVYALYCLVSNGDNTFHFLFLPFFLFIFSFLFVPIILIYGRIKKALFGRPRGALFAVLTAAIICVVFGFFLVRLYAIPWMGEQEINPLDKATTIVLKSDKPTSGLILRVEGHLDGTARINVPQLDVSFSLPADFNKVCDVDSVSGPYTVQYYPEGSPSGMIKLKWYFVYDES
jgi:hypothetical protein